MTKLLRVCRADAVVFFRYGSYRLVVSSFPYRGKYFCRVFVCVVLSVMFVVGFLLGASVLTFSIAWHAWFGLAVEVGESLRRKRKLMN